MLRISFICFQLPEPPKQPEKAEKAEREIPPVSPTGHAPGLPHSGLSTSAHAGHISPYPTAGGHQGQLGFESFTSSKYTHFAYDPPEGTSVVSVRVVHQVSYYLILYWRQFMVFFIERWS